MEWQVTNLEISQRIKELGVKQKSLWYWFEVKHSHSILSLSDKIPHGLYAHDIIGIYSAFTVAELGESLRQQDPFWIPYLDCTNKFWVVPVINEKCDTEANARGRMRIYLLENKRGDSQ